MAQMLDPRRILVVDDNHDAADLMAEIFTLHGHVARAAYGGVQGLHAAREFEPDVVFLDLGMPGMDGYQVAKNLRGMPELPQPVLIAFSAWSDDRAKGQGRAAGFDLHMAKPAKIETLLAAVDNALRAGAAPAR